MLELFIHVKIIFAPNVEVDWLNATIKRIYNKDFDFYYQTYKCTSEDCNTFINSSTGMYRQMVQL